MIILVLLHEKINNEKYFSIVHGYTRYTNIICRGGSGGTDL